MTIIEAQNESSREIYWDFDKAAFNSALKRALEANGVIVNHNAAPEDSEYKRMVEEYNGLSEDSPVQKWFDGTLEPQPAGRTAFYNTLQEKKEAKQAEEEGGWKPSAEMLSGIKLLEPSDRIPMSETDNLVALDATDLAIVELAECMVTVMDLPLDSFDRGEIVLKFIDELGIVTDAMIQAVNNEFDAQ